MRYLLFYILLHLHITVSGQDKAVTNTDGELKQLSSWKHKTGDDPSWAIPQLDDKEWKLININENISSGTPFKNGINWLRHKVKPLSSDSLYVLSLTQFGASEIYLNGTLIKQFGKISPSGQFTAFNPHGSEVPIILKKGIENVIAIKFAVNIPESNWLKSRSDFSPLNIQLQSYDHLVKAKVENKRMEVFRIGFNFITGALGFMFLLLFLFYPTHKLHLYFSLFNIFLVGIILLTSYLDTAQYDLYDRAYLYSLSTLLSKLIGVSILLFMLNAIGKMHRLIWWYIAFMIFIDFPLSLVLPVEYKYISNSFRSIHVFICLYIIYSAFRSQNKADYLIGILGLIVISVNSTFILNVYTDIDLSGFTLAFSPLLTAIITTVYVALRYSSANKSLEKQLVQVKNLSEENARQAKEKEMILLSQKELLEQQVKERTATLHEQKQKLQAAMEDLKSTQIQLIHREKMASLGELTAGIAHEIQNPLNFINNFSEISTELLDEMISGSNNGNNEVSSGLAEEIKANLQKINFHGKRADAIVKNMLQHSGKSSGKKQSTDVNRLVAEYLQLSYHGMRARQKNFNAIIETHFDQEVGSIDLVPEEMGRVLLNIFNNAFYSVNRKKEESGDDYHPTLSVSTSLINSEIQIAIRDNGKGIPESVVSKIYQPFFTTKPTGEGTGLGLSLSYDIITKAHNGEMKVFTKEGEFAEFRILLPANIKENQKI